MPLIAAVNTTATQALLFSTFSTLATNSTESTTTPYPALQPKQGLILFLITLPGTIANIIAFLATLKLIRTKKTGLAPNYLILALNATDFYGIVFCTLPTLLCYLKKGWVGGTPMCNFQGVSTMFSSLASGCLATAMAMERLIAVSKPFLYRQNASVNKAFLTIAVIWSSAFVIAVTPLAGSGNFVKNLTKTYCTINWFAKSKENIAYVIFYALIGVTLLIIVVYCNVKLVLCLLNVGKNREKLRSQSSMKKLVKNEDSNAEQKSKKAMIASNAMERQLAKTVALISLLFIICWAPFMIRIICNLAGVWANAWADVQVSRLLLLNFVLDPFLYTLSRKQCRDIVKGWLCCCCPKGRNHSVFSRFFLNKRQKHGTFISSSQTGSGSNLHTTNTSITMNRVKSSSVDATPSHSTENSIADIATNPTKTTTIADIVLHSNETENTRLKNEETNAAPLAADPAATEPDSSSVGDNKAVLRHHSESGRAAKKILNKEKMYSVPDMTEASGDNAMQVDVAYMYDLAFQRQTST